MEISEKNMLSMLDSAKKILLVEPPYPRKYPPFALAKIKTYLKGKGKIVKYSKKILPEKFDLICVTTLFTYYSEYVFSVVNNKGLINMDTPLLIGGVFASLMPEQFDKENTFVFKGYSKTLDLCAPDPVIMKDTDEKWLDVSWVFTSRGCPNKCLRGDTLVNTVKGNIPIKDLIGTNIGVYTYKDGQVFISDAINVRKMGKKKLVKVTFDDGTHIDCTPDHRYLTFKNGNQHVEASEKEIEAKDLQPGMSVRAIKSYKLKSGYVDISWGRRKHKHAHRMIMEYKIGRTLKNGEIVHHKDSDKSNNDPDNLELHSDMKEHFKKHPEISERMKKDNPSKYWTDESRLKMSKAIKGKKRSLETRKKISKAKLGTNNPNYKNGNYTGQKSRIEEVNHKVVSVKYIGTYMTYDLEVPETHWFFANNVLVHNCSFCTVWRIEKQKWVNPEWKKQIFMDRSVISIMDNNLSSIEISHMEDIVNFANKHKKRVIIESGFDCKYVTPELAKLAGKLKYARHGMRTAFDRIEEDGIFQKAVKLLQKNGVRAEDMFAYVLFNFNDRPKDAYYRAEECFKLGVRAYPQCYRPLNHLSKEQIFIGRHWTFRLTKAYRHYWVMKGVRGGFKDMSFEEWILSKDGRKQSRLTSTDIDVWLNNGR